MSLIHSEEDHTLGCTERCAVAVPASLLEELYRYVRFSLPTHIPQGGHLHRKKLQKKIKALLEL